MFNVRLVNFIYSQTLWTFISFIQLCAGLEIALFASSGCYSHDQMLIETGQGFVGHNISWFQAQSYQFSANPIKIPTDWNKLVLKRVGKEDEEIKSTGGSLLWNMNLPLDFSKPWDLRGNPPIFQHFTYTSSCLQRICAIKHVQEVLARKTSRFDCYRPLYSRMLCCNITLIKYDQRDVFELAACRWISDRNQHSVELHKNITLLVPAIATQSKQQFCSHECSVQREKVGSNQTNIKIQHSTLEKILIEGNLTEAERRYVETQLTFKDLDLSLLDEGPFVLVSFGSVALTCYMPAELLDRFLETFKQLAPLRFVWQTNSKPEDLLGQREAPDNLILVQWAPIKVLLAHSNLQYAVLHGGVNTLNELLFFGVPTLGVPLQGDQPSNVNRLKELGMADMITIGELYKPGAFAEKLLQFQKDLPRLRTRAHKVSSMISTYRELNGNGQNFWLYWAQRHGKRVQSSTTTGQKRSFFEQELRTAADYFAIKEVTIWSTLTLCLLFLISN
ncbi:UDP-glucuronosyl/UDP-glucosyltransferase family-containing protein [Aphelenchoides bicaudatus]|nr:UDP-glucuronosyl/UDP-glucosyltransferase family-containing protein [Aphelenchoides bicaudatus]